MALWFFTGIVGRAVEASGLLDSLRTRQPADTHLLCGVPHAGAPCACCSAAAAACVGCVLPLPVQWHSLQPHQGLGILCLQTSDMQRVCHDCQTPCNWQIADCTSAFRLCCMVCVVVFRVVVTGCVSAQHLCWCRCTNTLGEGKGGGVGGRSPVFRLRASHSYALSLVCRCAAQEGCKKREYHCHLWAAMQV